MQKYLIIVIIALCNNAASAHNPFWVAKDKKLIKQLVHVDKNNPEEVEQFFLHSTKREAPMQQQLGFGWSMWSTGIGGGYISISAQFYYYQDSLVSYSITPGLPEEKKLQNRYRSWYGDFFPSSEHELLTFHFRQEAILRPLLQFPGKTDAISEEIIRYMNPSYGIMDEAYDGDLVHVNSKAFLLLPGQFTREQVILMMHSISPATRLNAIGYYLYYIEVYPSDVNLENWIDLVFKELPTIRTMYGCFLETEPMRALFPHYFLKKLQRKLQYMPFQLQGDLL